MYESYVTEQVIADAGESSLVGVFGTLRSGEGNNALLNRCEPIKLSTLKGYRMYTMGGVGSIPFIVESDEPDAQVTVEVFEPTDLETWPSILERLDGLEGHPNWYCRELVKVDGFDKLVWVYTFSEDQLRQYMSGGRCTPIPSGDWLNPYEDRGVAA